jgi:tripeptide aminopeptidase
MINTERVKQTFLDLVHINSPSKHERAAADYVKAKLAALGFEVKEDATILGADDKAAVAAILEAVESLAEDGVPHGDLRVIFDVAEEIGLFGARQLDPSDLNAEMGFVIDTMKPVAGITWSAPSHVNLLVEITGKASHAGMAPEQGVSAIVAASNAISKMNLGRIDDETTANIGVIEGGKARNIIPDRVQIKAEARSRNESKLAAQVEHMKSVFEHEAAKVGAHANVELEQEYYAFKWTGDDDVVKLAAEASRSMGIEPVLSDGGGGSDANVFNKAGLASVVIGVGYDGIHSPSENISVTDLAKCAEYSAALVKTAAGAGG